VARKAEELLRIRPSNSIGGVDRPQSWLPRAFLQSGIGQHHPYLLSVDPLSRTKRAPVPQRPYPLHRPRHRNRTQYKCDFVARRCSQSIDNLKRSTWTKVHHHPSRGYGAASRHVGLHRTIEAKSETYLDSLKSDEQPRKNPGLAVFLRYSRCLTPSSVYWDR